MAKVFDILAPIIENWNKDNYFKMSIVQEEDSIIVSPVNADRTAHLPGSIVSDIAALSQVYGFIYGIHATNNAPYILI